MNKICAICGKEINKRTAYSNSEGRFACSDECFDTLYWNDIVAEKEKHIVFNGVCALIKPEKRFLVGCNGYEYKFRNLATGEIVVTHNLWIQGEIPTTHRPMLPDTHEKIS